MELNFTFLLTAFIVTVNFHFGFTSNTAAGADDLAGLTLTCGNQIEFKMTKNFVNSNFPLQGSETLRVGIDLLCHGDPTQTADTNADCDGVKDGSDESWTFTFGIGSCNPAGKVESKTTIYSYTVIKKDLDANSSPINRYSCQKISFACKFPMEYDVTASSHIIAKSTATKSNDEATKAVALGIALTDSSYDALSTATAYKVGDAIYMKIAFDPAGPAEMVLQASTCIAESPDKKENYKIISTSGCPESTDVVIEGRSGTAVKFNFKSFYWANAAYLTMTITCSVKVCRKVGDEKCIMTPDSCPSMRYRREVENEKALDSHVLTIGPIVIQPRDPCLNQNGGCDGSCNLVQNEISCSCERGQIQPESDKTKCHKINPLIMEQYKLAKQEQHERNFAARMSEEEQKEEEMEEELIDSVDNELLPANEDKSMIVIAKDELMEMLSNSDGKDVLLIGVAIAVLITSIVGSIIYCRKGKK